MHSRSRNVGEVFSSLVGDALALALVGLTILGVGGAVYKGISADGWTGSLLQPLWDKSPGLVWLVAFAMAAGALAVRHYYVHTPRKGSGGNAVVYGFLALGLFFFFRLLVTGTL
jgi:hypothetical protein